MCWMKHVTPRDYEKMRTEILDAVCARLEREAPLILERADEQSLLQHAHELYRRGGIPLPEVIGRRNILRRIVRASQVLLANAVNKHLLWMGDFDEERSRLQAAADQQYQDWIEEYRSWVE